MAEFGRLSHEFIEQLTELHKCQLCWWRVQSEDQLSILSVCLSQLLEKRQKADSGADKSAELKPRDGTQIAMFSRERNDRFYQTLHVPRTQARFIIFAQHIERSHQFSCCFPVN